MKTSFLLLLVVTIAVVKSQKCTYKKWGNTIAAVEKKFRDCKNSKSTGEEFTECMEADEGTFTICSANIGDTHPGRYENIDRCLAVLKQSCKKKTGRVDGANGARINPGGTGGDIYISKSEGERKWWG